MSSWFEEVKKKLKQKERESELEVMFGSEEGKKLDAC